MKFKAALFLSACTIAHPVLAQDAPTTATTPTAEESSEGILVTGSRIRRNPDDSALPLQVVTTEQLRREGINSPEQLISFLSTNGNGSDNLASNADVTSGAQRGTNGLSAANLRGQGASSTLVLLNGRRVAAHGLTGSAVDVNQIPFAAIERVEVLKDGASAIYGTDAIGGVINFITKNDFQGVSLAGFTDVTEKGDGNIYRLSGTVGYGDLAEQGFNIMGAVSYSWNQLLRGSNRDFVNSNQPSRGLSADTRGTPIATIFPIGVNTTFGAPQGSLLFGTTVPGGGVNVLDLPGGAGCGSMEGGMPYDEQLWAAPTALYACAWDTGRAAVLQQPLETLTYYGRATARLGAHEIFAEITGSDAKSAKIFSNNQYSGNNSTLPLYYPLNSLTAATYNDIYNRLLAAFPTSGLAANYGRPIAYRWRCVACGEREYNTDTKTLRATLGMEGPIAGGWDYRIGGSFARSQVESVLGRGYHYRGVFPSAASAANSGVAGAANGGIDPRAPTAPGATAPGIVGLLNSGILNPFAINQSAAALAGLDAVSAEGVLLYAGEYRVWQVDASVSGSLFALPGGDAQLAVGVDFRRETYKFDGSSAGIVGAVDIFNAAFDNVNALTPRSRDIKAAYAEVLLPVFDMLEVTLAGRVDDYSGFGTTWNPKVSAKFTPTDWLLVRGSFNTGFRAPNFNQQFNGATESPLNSASTGDPLLCPNGVVTAGVPGCVSIASQNSSAVFVNRGNPAVGPEESTQYSVGAVFQPSRHFTASVDFWSIAVDDVIGSPTLQEALRYAQFFPASRIVRNPAGIIQAVDLQVRNLGSRRTEGLEVAVRGNIDVGGGTLSAGIEGTYLLKKRERLVDAAPWQDKIGVFSYSGDLGLKWKHNASISWTDDVYSFSLSQIFRNGYQNNQQIPGALTRPNYNARVDDYIIYNLSAGARIAEGYTLTFGIKNIFDTDPPFAITYDSATGAGSSWEPRVADPRGRSFTVAVEARF